MNFLSELKKHSVFAQPIDWRACLPLLRLFFFFLFWDNHFRFIRFYQNFGEVEGDWLWPVFWPNSSESVLLIFLLFSVSSLAAVFFPLCRWNKVVCFFSYFFLLAMLFSFGKIDHSRHASLFALLLLCGLGEPKTKKQEENFQTLVVFAMAVPFLFYSISGLWKFQAMWNQLFFGESFFAWLSRAIPNNVSLRALHSQWEHKPVVEFFLKAPALSSVLWLGTIFLETFAVAAVFAKRKWRLLFAFGLVFMNVGIYALMRISFFQMVFVLMMFSLLYPDQKNRR